MQVYTRIKETLVNMLSWCNY